MDPCDLNFTYQIMIAYLLVYMLVITTMLTNGLCIVTYSYNHVGIHMTSVKVSANEGENK